MGQASASAVLKHEIEVRLATRIPGALSSHAPKLLPTGVAAIDALLGGGLPLGGVCELAGAHGSGRTSLALSMLAEASREAACAYVDAGGCLDPFSVAAAGVRLENLLWVRVPSQDARPLPIRNTGVELREGSVPRPTDQAFEVMLANRSEARLRKQEGTPGHPSQPFGLAAAPREHAAFERMFESGPLVGEPQRKTLIKHQSLSAEPRPANGKQPLNHAWSLLELAIRAADQILQSGGFRVVVLDLAYVAPEQARRIPAATWFRFRRAAEESDAILLVPTAQPCAGSSAACVLHCSPGAVVLENGLLRGIAASVAVARQRFAGPEAKKAPGRAALWQAVPAWMREAGS